MRPPPSSSPERPPRPASTERGTRRRSRRPPSPAPTWTACTARPRSPPRSTTAPRRRRIRHGSGCATSRTRRPAPRRGSTRPGRPWAPSRRRQYRAGGLDPALRLMLSEDPDAYLDGAALTERAGSRHHAELGRARAQLREIEKLRGAARVEAKTLTARRAELRRHKKTVTEKLSAARLALSRMSPEQRDRITGGSDRAARSAAGAVRDAAAPSQAPNARAARRPSPTPTGSSAALTSGARPARTPSTARASSWPRTAPPVSPCRARPTRRSARAAASPAPNSSRRPGLLLLRHQPRRPLHRQRADDPRPEPVRPGPRGAHRPDAVRGGDTGGVTGPADSNRIRPAQTRRRAVAQRVSSWRLDSWSLRSTAETCDSTVFTEMNSCLAISLYA